MSDLMLFSVQRVVKHKTVFELRKAKGYTGYTRTVICPHLHVCFYQGLQPISTAASLDSYSLAL